jgi:hypothetical protein
MKWKSFTYMEEKQDKSQTIYEHWLKNSILIFFASYCVLCFKGIVVLMAPKYTYTSHTWYSKEHTKTTITDGQIETKLNLLTESFRLSPVLNCVLIYILSDSQAALKALGKHQIISKLVWDCHQTLTELAKHNWYGCRGMRVLLGMKQQTN